MTAEMDTPAASTSPPPPLTPQSSRAARATKMMNDSWPYPGDSPVVRARRVAHAYRSKLLTIDPAACHEVDKQMFAWGQSWVTPRILTYGLDDWLTVAEACDIASIAPATLRIWRTRQRIAGRLKGGRWHYLARDVLALASTTRPRHKVTDIDTTLADPGEENAS